MFSPEKYLSKQINENWNSQQSLRKNLYDFFFFLKFFLHQLALEISFTNSKARKKASINHFQRYWLLNEQMTGLELLYIVSPSTKTQSILREK
jgi:hypothetical protein